MIMILIKGGIIQDIWSDKPQRHGSIQICDADAPENVSDEEYATFQKEVEEFKQKTKALYHIY